MNEEQIKAAREWLKDCQWDDLDCEEVDELPDEEIVKGIKRHYDGGINSFLMTFDWVTR